MRRARSELLDDDDDDSVVDSVGFLLPTGRPRGTGLDAAAALMTIINIIQPTLCGGGRGSRRYGQIDAGATLGGGGFFGGGRWCWWWMRHNTQAVAMATPTASLKAVRPVFDKRGGIVARAFYMVSNYVLQYEIQTTTTATTTTTTRGVGRSLVRIDPGLYHWMEEYYERFYRGRRCLGRGPVSLAA